MAERVFRNTVGTQGHDAAAYYRGFSEVAKRTYPGESEQFVGEELFGADTFGTDGLHHEAYYHTGLQGQAAIMPTDVVRQDWQHPDSGLPSGWYRLRVLPA